jgi:hypothetical protein
MFGDGGFEAEGIEGVDEGIVINHVADLAREREEGEVGGVDVGHRRNGGQTMLLGFTFLCGSGHVVFGGLRC